MAEFAPHPKPSVRKKNRAFSTRRLMDAARPTVVERSGGACEVCRSARAVHMHHIKRRSQGGESTPENLLHVCYDCHIVRIHGSPKWAKEMGYLWDGPRPTT